MVLAPTILTAQLRGQLIEGHPFREVIRQFSSTVLIITVTSGERIHGMTATSFAVVSFHQPTVLVCIRQASQTHQMVLEAGHFAVNVLHQEQRLVSELFAGRLGESDNRFTGLEWHPSSTGSPILSDCLAWLDCQVAAHYAAEDHTIFIGNVLAGDTNRPGRPLLYHNGSYFKIPKA